VRSACKIGVAFETSRPNMQCLNSLRGELPNVLHREVRLGSLGQCDSPRFVSCMAARPGMDEELRT
jgi:hypothetical protein